MFLFGILSGPLPYLLMAVFYFFGFATGMFKGNEAEEPNIQAQVKNIQVDPITPELEKSAGTFQFQEFKSAFQKQNKDTYFDLTTIQPPPFTQNRGLIYYVQDKKINHSTISDSFYCRPPPTIG